MPIERRRKPAYPNREYYDFLKTKGIELQTMFMLISNNIIRNYFTLSYHDTGEYEFDVGIDETVVLEAWKKGKNRSTPSLKHSLNDVDTTIILEIYTMMRRGITNT